MRDLAVLFALQLLSIKDLVELQIVAVINTNCHTYIRKKVAY